MNSIRSSYHPIDAAMLWCDLAAYQEEIRRADLLVWFVRTFPDQRPSFLFPPNPHHSGCVSLNAHLVQEAEIDASQRTIEKLRQRARSNYRGNATLLRCNRELSERLDACGIPSEASERMHNTIVGAMLEATLGKTKGGQVQSIYPSQAALVEEITRRFPGVGGLSKSTLDRDLPRLVAISRRFSGRNAALSGNAGHCLTMFFPVTKPSPPPSTSKTPVEPPSLLNTGLPDPDERLRVWKLKSPAKRTAQDVRERLQERENRRA
ncbi:hypothetical protein [Pseudomonas putida]|uniref:hypothetical protein n=1 Tax=Pseudomonas putida TaxID=303 RepID=UPI00383ABB5E